jgi:hypothetical protein
MRIRFATWPVWRTTAVIAAAALLLTLVLAPLLARALGPHATFVRIAGALSATAAGQVDVTATLSDQADQGAPVPGKVITFTLGAQTVTATTDSQGVARATLTFTAGAAASVTAGFAGDAAYTASGDAADFGPVAVFPEVPKLNHSQSRYVAMVPNAGGLFSFGGTLPTSGFAGGYQPLFINLDPNRISDASRPDPLGTYDTVVLNGICDIGTRLANAAFRSRLQTFALNGGKLVIYDSECTTTNYAQFFLPFTTNNPGARGASGLLQIAEQNSLSSSDAASPYFIDVGKISTQTDAVGDANVFVTYDPNWCVDLMGKNVLSSELRPAHTYALLGQGLVIYNGLDRDYMFNPLRNLGSGAYYLGKLFELEMKQAWAPSGLPCEQSVAPATITLGPASATHNVGETHTANATVTDGNGQPLAGVYVTLQRSGANPGAQTATTNASGAATFTYTGTNGGVDSLVVQAGAIHSNTAAVHWNAAPCGLVWKSPADGTTPYDVPVGSTVTLRFSWGDCSRFIHDESVIVQVENPNDPNFPITTWVYGFDIIIDDVAEEYRVDFTPSLYGLQAGTTLPVSVYMGGQLAGQALLHLTP